MGPVDVCSPKNIQVLLSDMTVLAICGHTVYQRYVCNSFSI